MKAILSHLKQPSTIRGFSVLAGLLGLSLSPAHWEAIAAAVAAAIGLIEVFRKEK